jgi:hypothetical protein
MTTNVICKRRKLLATDSRWSFMWGEDHLCFVDAPTGQQVRPWTKQETADLHAALADLARREEAANR